MNTEGSEMMKQIRRRAYAQSAMMVAAIAGIWTAAVYHLDTKNGMHVLTAFSLFLPMLYTSTMRDNKYLNRAYLAFAAFVLLDAFALDYALILLEIYVGFLLVLVSLRFRFKRNVYRNKQLGITFRKPRKWLFFERDRQYKTQGELTETLLKDDGKLVALASRKKSVVAIYTANLSDELYRHMSNVHGILKHIYSNELSGFKNARIDFEPRFFDGITEGNMASIMGFTYFNDEIDKWLECQLALVCAGEQFFALSTAHVVNDKRGKKDIKYILNKMRINPPIPDDLMMDIPDVYRKKKFLKIF